MRLIIQAKKSISNNFDTETKATLKTNKQKNDYINTNENIFPHFQNKKITNSSKKHIRQIMIDKLINSKD